MLFTYRSIQDRIPADHPLRAMRRLVDPLLVEVSPRFQALYSAVGRPPIPPEQLLRALLLQVLYTIRSERQLMEQLDYNLLYRWFVGLTPDDAVWVPTVFTKNRDRLLAGKIAEAFFNAVQRVAHEHQLLSLEHFTVDGTLLEAWASHKSFRPIEAPAPPSDDDPSNPSVNFRGEKRSNATHRSVTDPDARMVRKTRHGAAFLGYQASVLTENRHGLIVQTDVRAPGYHAERDAALEMLTLLHPRRGRRTLGADKGYDTPDFIAGVRALGFTPHVSPNRHRYRRRSTVDGRTTRHLGYEVSQRERTLVEEGFGWQKCVGLLRKLHHRGRELVSWVFTFTSAAYNLVRLRTLLATAPT
ncbi:MAG: IS5 family transposase [Gemmatimonadetes bacterium]|nr:IS5 family transposase [Gemmatimonadota bacterium]